MEKLIKKEQLPTSRSFFIVDELQNDFANIANLNVLNKKHMNGMSILNSCVNVHN